VFKGIVVSKVSKELLVAMVGLVFKVRRVQMDSKVFKVDLEQAYRVSKEQQVFKVRKV